MNAKKGRMSFEKRHMDNEFKHMLIKFIILKRISESDIYAYRLLKEVENLPRIEFFCSDKNKLKNDIYNAINALSKDGYIKVVQKKVGKRVRNYYTLTNEGKESMRNIKENFINAVTNIKKILKV
jgi:DNA-binding PadR family transcriptional regulator